MLISIIIAISIIIIMMSYIVYELIVAKQELTTKIIIAQDSIYELERYEIHSQNEIEGWIEDSVRDLQYDVDDHGTAIDDLKDDIVTFDDLEETKKNIEDSEHRIMDKVKQIYVRLHEIYPDKEPELIMQERIDEVLSINIRTGRYTKDDNGKFFLREQDETAISLSDTARKEITELLMRLAEEDEFISFNENTYKGEKDEMATKEIKKTPAKILSQSKSS